MYVQLKQYDARVPLRYELLVELYIQCFLGHLQECTVLAAAVMQLLMRQVCLQEQYQKGIHALYKKNGINPVALPVNMVINVRLCLLGH